MTDRVTREDRLLALEIILRGIGDHLDDLCTDLRDDRVKREQDITSGK